MAVEPVQKEYAQSTASSLTRVCTIAILCLSGVMFCIAGIGYAGMPVHSLRWAHMSLQRPAHQDLPACHDADACIFTRDVLRL